MKNTHIVIMAGGKGTRMRSELPKVLHTIGGETLLQRVLRSAQEVAPTPTIIVGYGAEEVMRATGEGYDYVLQEEQLGTGHAVSVAIEHLRGRDIDKLIVVPGDHPLLSAETLRDLSRAHAMSDATIMLGTVCVPDFEDWRATFTDAGRIVRDEEGNVLRIVERKDATEAELAIMELNVSFYSFGFKWLCEHIDALSNMNVAKEFYLTDFVTIARGQGKKIVTVPITRIEEGLGVNSPEQLARAEMFLSVSKERPFNAKDSP